MSQHNRANLIQSFLTSALVIPTEGAESQRRIAYICNIGSDTVSVIDLGSCILETSIEVGKYPVFSQIYPHDRRKLIVTLHNAAPGYKPKEGCGFLIQVDLQTGEIVRRPYSGIAIPSAILYDDMRDLLYVADENMDKGYVHVHHGRTLSLLYSLPAGRGTVHVDISSDGQHLAATNRISADLSVYDLEMISKKPFTAQDYITIPLGRSQTGHPFDVKFSKNPDICYVTDFSTGELLVVDIVKRMVIDRIKVGKNLFGLAVNIAGTTAYVCDLSKNSISVIDLQNRKVIGEISGLDGVSSHCAIDEKEHQLVVSCQGGRLGGSVYIIDLETKEIIATIIDEKIRGSIGVTIDV